MRWSVLQPAYCETWIPTYHTSVLQVCNPFPQPPAQFGILAGGLHDSDPPCCAGLFARIRSLNYSESRWKSRVRTHTSVTHKIIFVELQRATYPQLSHRAIAACKMHPNKHSLDALMSCARLFTVLSRVFHLSVSNLSTSRSPRISSLHQTACTKHTFLTHSDSSLTYPMINSISLSSPLPPK